MKLYSILYENSQVKQEYNYGPVYHGGKWDGKAPIKVSGRGALGSGAYFTPIKSVAQKYADESSGEVIETYLKIKNPLILKMDSKNIEHPCVKALIQLGIPEEKAENKVEKIEELKGYIGKEISSLAIKNGYDSIFQYFDGVLKEIVIWSPGQAETSSQLNS